MSPEIIDIGGLDSDGTRSLDRVAAEIEGPSRSIGVFHIVGHGLSETDLARFESAMRALFALPAPVKHQMRRSRGNAWGYFDEELTKNRPDWKEIFDYGGRRYSACPPRSSRSKTAWNTRSRCRCARTGRAPLVGRAARATQGRVSRGE